eukprot:10272526-Prorocentrum_lima.AAC.1
MPSKSWTSCYVLPTGKRVANTPLVHYAEPLVPVYQHSFAASEVELQLVVDLELLVVVDLLDL